ncbi:MAG: CCA tRNA nucleotidyltransferase [Hyphomicrobiaceae bacterium]|nr:CCA tRNA nucleotidyltransferase [Hyphomicrobiaceae bacterium]
MSARSTNSSSSIAGAEWLSWPGTVRVFEALCAGDHTALAVGGAVRDTLLGRPVQDVDFATDAPPERVMELAQAAGLKAIPTGIRHGTVTVVADYRGFEVTTLRRDVETFGRHATVAFTEDWVADASRRDFSINALYADADGTVFDPLNAIADIEKPHVRFIGDALARVAEDYLRILRFFRLNAELETEDFDTESLSACVRGRAGLHGLSGERVAGELKRLLGAGGAVMSLRKMFDFGLLVEILHGAPNISRFERLAAIEAALDEEADAMLRLGGIGVFVREDAERLAATLRLSNVERDRLVMFARLPAVAEASDESELRRLVFRFGKDGAHDAALKSWACSEKPASNVAWRKLVQRIARLPVPEFPLQGADLVELGAAEGPAVGKILKQLEAQWLESGCTESRKNLLAAAKELVLTGAERTSGRQ